MILEIFSQADFNDYMNQSENNYAKEIATAKEITIQEALEISSQEFQKTLPDGLNTLNNYFYKIISDYENVGMIWICIYTDNNQKLMFIYDLEIKKQFRQKGFAKRALELIEDKGKKYGAQVAGLHVFYHNEIAFNLYKNSGYVETKSGKKSTEMEKKIL